MDAFNISDAELLPKVCAVCHYSLQGLPEPRCPECGERVMPGEVVVLGVSMHRRDRAGLGNSLVESFGTVATAGVLAMLIVGFLHPKDISVFFPVVVGMSVLLATLLVSQTLLAREIGQPRGIWRVRDAGFCFGAGATIGRVQPWTDAFRVELVKRQGYVQIRVVRMWKGVPVRLLYKIHAVCEEQSLEGIAERIRKWSDGRTRVRFVA